MLKLCGNVFGLCYFFELFVSAADAPVGQVTKDGKLVEWVKSNGGTVKGLTVKTLPSGYRGVFAENDIEKGEIPIVIPKELMIHREFALDPKTNPAFSAFFSKLKASIPLQTTDCVLLMIYLMHEKFYNENQTSISVYIKSLPNLSVLSAIPMNWEADLKEMFKSLQSGKHHWDSYVKSKQELRVFARDILYPFMKENGYSVQSVDEFEQQFAWASMIVGTRAWGGDLHDDYSDITCTLIPLQDMVNHDSQTANPIAKVFENDEQIGAGMQMPQPYKAGDEIFLNYKPLEKKSSIL